MTSGGQDQFAKEAGVARYGKPRGDREVDGVLCPPGARRLTGRQIRWTVVKVKSI